MEEKKDNTKTYFYELYTKYGTLFFYEKHDTSLDSPFSYRYGEIHG